MNKPVQYILCGLPFSGKTTLGNELQKRLGFVHINLDEIKAAKGYGEISDDNVPEKVWKSIFAEADKKLTQALKEGRNVANETAWVTRAWRDRAREVALREGFQTKVIYINIPEAIVRERWGKNRSMKHRYDTKDDEFEGYVRDFEIPANDEDVILYDETIPIEHWIETNFKS